MRFDPKFAAVLILGIFVLLATACGSADDPSAESDSSAAVVQPAPTAAPSAPVAVQSSEPTPAPEPTVEPTAGPAPEPTSEAAAMASEYPAAPELEKTGGWINTEPFTLADLQAEGKVVLIDFWTYTCINCIRTLPYIKTWHEKYADNGLVILGVHTPEFNFEHDYENVVEAAGKFKLEYPIVQDNDFGTWRAFENRYWPAKYLIDHNGFIRYSHFGEGAYDETEQKIRELLTEAGYVVAGVAADSDPETGIASGALTATPGEGQTRELYAGFDRNYGALRSMTMQPYVRHVEYYEAPNREVLYQDPGEHENHFLYLNGLWRNGEESLIHARETEEFEDYMALKFFGTSVNVVMSPGVETAYDVVVYVDDAPVPEEAAGWDIMYDDDGNSYVSVDESRMYYLVNKETFGGGELRLTSNSPDFSVFAFTFGSYEGGEPVNES